MNFKPLKDGVLVKEIKKEEKTESGIILPENHEKEGPLKGQVIAVGEGKRGVNGELISVSVKEGDEILFKKGYGVDEIEIEKEKYLIMKEDDIIGII
jgi:chaperonin GroES